MLCDLVIIQDIIYAVTNIDAELLMHIQMFIPVKALSFSKRIQQSNLITEMMI